MPATDTPLPTPDQDREDAQRRFELARDLAEGPMAVLSLVALALVVLEVAVPLSPRAAAVLTAGQWLTWGAFALEYVVFLVLAPDKGRYVRRNWFGLLTVVLPFLRVFRVLRVVRAARAIRAVRAVNLTRRNAVRLRSVLQWSSFAYASLVAALVTVVAAAAMVALEAGVERATLGTYPQALWWAFGIVTTIGSSYEPVTPEGRLLAVPLYLIGLGVQAFLGGVIAASLVGQRQEDAAEAERGASEGQRPAAAETASG